MVQMPNREAAHIPEFNALQMGPKALAGIQLWGIGGEALHMEPLRRTISQELCDQMTAVDRRTIPDKHHLSRHLPQQVLEKSDHIVRVNRTVLAVEVELALRGDGADRGQMVAGTPLPQNGGVAYRGIGADDTGQGIEPGFIDEENRLRLGLCPLLSAGQVSSRQRAMAASSRCRARRTGFCGLQRSAFSKRPTWTG
jgi:hypothetical protein